MKKARNNMGKGSRFRRVIAGVLAISMVLIPVQFSNRASAVQEGFLESFPPNYMVDDYANSQFLNGVKYQYVTEAYDASVIEKGVYSCFLSDYSNNKLLLNTKDANGGNPSAFWTDYTVEADVQRDGGKTSSDVVYLIGRYSAAGYYAVMFAGMNFSLATVDAEGNVKRLKDLGSSVGDSTYDQWVHIKMTFRGSTISIILTGNKLDGTPVETVHTFENSTYTMGGVGLWAARGTASQKTWTARFKNFKVTLADGTVAYSGGIDTKSTYTANGVEYTWTETLSSKYNFSDCGGNLVLSSGPKDGEMDEEGRRGVYNNAMYVIAESYDPIANRAADLAQSWDNYTVEANVTRLETDANEMAGIMGRMTFNKSGKFGSYYLFAVKADRIILYKYYYDAQGAWKNVPLMQGVGLLPAGTDATGPKGTTVHLKMEFLDDTIKCYFNGVLAYEVVDDGYYGEPLRTGTAGIFMQSRGWAAAYDNFLITFSNDVTSFYDDFSDERFFNGVTYQMQSTGEPIWQDVTYHWTTNLPVKFEDGAFKVTTYPNMIKKWSFLNGVTEEDIDVDAQWYNYTVEADVWRSGDPLTTGDHIFLLGKVNDNGFYALDFNGEISFYTGDATGTNLKRILNKGGFGRTYNGWAHLKMTFRYDVITLSATAVVDGEEKTVTYEVPNDKLTEKFSSGGIGFGVQRGTGANWDAYIKNIKVTLDDGRVVYNDPFNEATFEPTTTYSWNTQIPKDTSITLENGAAKFSTALAYRRSIVAFLNGITEDGRNIADYWTDYKVEVDMKRENGAEDVQMYLMGRVNPDGSYYSLSYNGSDLYLWKCYYNENNELVSHRLANKGTGKTRADEGWSHLWMEFEGNVITYGISFVSEDGTQTSKEFSVTHTDQCASHTKNSTDTCVSVLTGGGIGLRADSTGADASGDGPWIGWFDNLKVTLPNGIVVYEDCFGADSTEDVTVDTALDDDGMVYVPFADTKTPNNGFYPEGRVEEGVYAESIIKNWSISNGSIFKTGDDTEALVVQMFSAGRDIAREWVDYSAEVDFMLTGSASMAGLVFHYTDSGYYQIAFDGVNGYLYHSSSETPLVTKEISLGLNVWQFVKVEALDGKVNCYVNGILLMSYAIGSNGVGTVGLKAANNVYFDNFAVYPNQSSSLRKYTSYNFYANTPDELTSVWIFDNTEKWSISQRRLQYSGDGLGRIRLRAKVPLVDYYAEISATPTSNQAIFGVQGRVNGSNGYALTMDMTEGIALTRNGVTLGAVSKEQLYVNGLLVLANQEYALRMEMYGGSIHCFVNGQLVLKVKDSNPLPTGVAGVIASQNVQIRALTVGQAYQDTVLSIVDRSGNPVTDIQVNPGKVPNLKNWYLKADKGDGAPLYIDLDMVIDDSQFQETATGTVTIAVQYDGAEFDFVYTVVERPEYIAQLNADIAALNLNQLDEETVKELNLRFNDLSYLEKPGITEENQQKLASARRAIEVMRFPELANYNMVLEETFDTKDVIDDFRIGRWLNGTRNTGEWYVENGIMYQYSEDESLRTMSTQSAAVLDTTGYKVKYISVDAQVQGRFSWIGIRLYREDLNNSHMTFQVSDKNVGYFGNRIRLYKSGIMLAGTVEKDESKWIQEGDWVRLEMIFCDDGYIRCYVNGQLYLEAQDYPSMGYDFTFDTGKIALYTAEGYDAFDNLIVYGEEVEVERFDMINEDLPASSWSDNFQDEKENAGKDPSHWIESNVEDKWVVKISGDNVYYSADHNTQEISNTWLHVLETNIDFSAQLRVTELGEFPSVGLTARLVMKDSYIHAGYDFFLQKWFVEYQAYANVDPVVIYADTQDTEVDFNDWVTVRLKIVGSTLELYKGSSLVMTADVTDKPGPGRVGVFAARCDVDIDNVHLDLLSGQSHVQDGVLQYYTEVFGITGSMNPCIVTHDGNVKIGSYISRDDGKTFERDTSYSNISNENTVLLHDGNYVTIHSTSSVDETGKTIAKIYAKRGILQPDGSYLWVNGGQLPTEDGVSYAQPQRHPTEYQLADGTYRIFWTAVDNHGEGGNNDAEIGSWARVWYSDDGGITWQESANRVEDVLSLVVFCESFIVQVSQDTTDLAGNFIPKGTLVHCTNYNARTEMTYTLSFDGGVTWEGDYAMPNLPSPQGSFAVKEDPWNPGTYYMCMFYNYPDYQGHGGARLRVSLFRSYDGLNWNFLCDVDRWDAESGGPQEALFHATNCYIEIGEDYVYPCYGRNEMWQPGNNVLRSVFHRFEKSKLVDHEIPKEYNIDDKEILCIEAIPVQVDFRPGDEFSVAGNKILIHYYDGTTELMDMEDAYIYEVPDMSKEGIVNVKAVHKLHTATYEIAITAETHRGGTATCTDRAICEICGQPYGRTVEHNVVFVPGHPATWVTEGTVDHYECTCCHETFADAQGKWKAGFITTPALSKEESKDLDGDYFADDFTSSNEVDYQWNEGVFKPGISTETANGGYVVTIPNQGGNLNFVQLSGVLDGVNVIRKWSNYTVSADLSLDAFVPGSAEYFAGLMGYVDENGYGFSYRIDGSGNTGLWYYGPVATWDEAAGDYVRNVLGKIVYSDPMWICLVEQATGICGGEQIHVSMKFENFVAVGGEKHILITVSESGILADGQRFERTYQFSSNTIVSGKLVKPLLAGAVGMAFGSGNVSRSDYITSVQYTYDNICVTDNATGLTVFRDEFADAKHQEGVAENLVSTEHEYQDFRFQEVDLDTELYNFIINSGAKVMDGKYYFYGTTTRGHNQYAAFVQAKNREGEYELPKWKDFTIETNLNWSSTGQKAGAAIYGRVSYDSATGQYSYYAVNVTRDGIYILKCVNGTKTIVVDRQRISAPSVRVTFATQADDSLKITVVASKNYEYVDTDPLKEGAVGIGYAGNTTFNGDYWVSFENLRVTSADGKVLLAEEFDAKADVEQTTQTPDYRWEQQENEAAAGVASKWSMINGISNVYAVHFENPRAGSISTFRMDLQMQVNGKDATRYLSDYAVQLRSWMGQSGNPDAQKDSWLGVASTNSLHTGVLLRVQPVYDASGNVVDYTYYRVQVSQNKLYIEKRYYNTATQQCETAVLSSKNLTHNEDVWYVFHISIIGNTISVRRPTARGTNLGSYQGSSAIVLSYTDDGTYGAPLTSGSISLWAQAEYSTADAPDLNVYFDEVKLYTVDMNPVFYDDFESDTYLGETAAPGAAAFLLFDNYAYTDDRAYTVQKYLTVDASLADHWQVVQEEDNDILQKKEDSSDGNYALIAVQKGEQNEAAANWTDYGVKVQVKLPQAAYAGILLRYNGFSGYELRFDGSHVYLLRMDGGKVTKLYQGQQLMAADCWHAVDVQICGATIRYSINGEQMVTIDIADSGLLQTGTAGFSATALTAFDDVRVYSLGQAPEFSVRDGYIYCQSGTLTVKDPDGDLVAVLVNGVAVENPNEPIQISRLGENVITAIDAMGHSATITVTLGNGCAYRDVINTIGSHAHYQACIYCNQTVEQPHDIQENTGACTEGCAGVFMSASFNATGYSTIEQALNAAGEMYWITGQEQTVTLSHDLITRGIVVGFGVKLDLNGYHLDTTGFVNFGQVIDGVGTGGLRIISGEGSGLYLGTNEWLPLLDRSTGHYRFFQYDFQNKGHKEDGEYHKFGLSLIFEKAEAYDLLAASDVKIGFCISWTGLEQDLYYFFTEQTVVTYANTVKDQLNAGKTMDQIKTAMVIKVRQLDVVNKGYPGTLTVMPIIMAVGMDIIARSATQLSTNPM